LLTILYSKPGFLTVGLDFIVQLDDTAFLELLYKLTQEETIYLIEIRKHLDLDDREVMLDQIVHQMSFRELLQSLSDCEDPAAKHCRLCRVKRLEALEFRLLHEGQMPDGMLKVPGCMPLVEKADVWKAEDERNYTFDVVRLDPCTIFIFHLMLYGLTTYLATVL
jgi:hypothetical protein